MSFNRLRNKTILITGATSGIGLALAKLLASCDTKLILLGRREDRLKQITHQLSSMGTKVQMATCDVCDEMQVRDSLTPFLEDQVGIDVLINNAGLALGLEGIDEGDTSHWNRMIDTNIKGLLYVTKTLLPHFKAKNKGHIINLGSIAGEVAYPGGNVYCATKAAVDSLTQSLNADLLGTKIRVSNVAPGACETEFSQVRFGGDEAKAKATYDGYTPLNAQDIADLIVYILNTPEHINIQHTRIMPTDQRNPYLVHRGHNVYR